MYFLYLTLVVPFLSLKGLIFCLMLCNSDITIVIGYCVDIYKTISVYQYVGDMFIYKCLLLVFTLKDFVLVLAAHSFHIKGSRVYIRAVSV